MTDITTLTLTAPVGQILTADNVVNSNSVTIHVTPTTGTGNFTAINVITWTAANGFSAIDWTVINTIDVFHMNTDGSGNLTWDGTPTPSLGTIISTAHSHNAKVLLSIGGNNLTEPTIASILNSPTNFINNAMAVIQQNGFDGIKIDFENPGYSPTAFTAFIKELRTALGPNRLLNVDTASYIWSSQNISGIEQYVDHFLNMCYNGTQQPLATVQTSMTSLAAMLSNKKKATLGIRLDYETQLAAKMQWARAQGYGVFFWEASHATSAEYAIMAQNP